MSDVSVSNTTSGLSGKTLLATDADATVTGLHTYNRGSGSAPFAVGSGAAVVSNLDADKLDGVEGSGYATLTGSQTLTNKTLTAPTLTSPTVSSGFVTATTQPRASAYHNTTQSLNNATLTALTLNAEDYDVGAMHDTSVNPSRMTIPSGGDGLYLVVGRVTFAANATGERLASLYKNGSEALRGTRAANNGASNTTDVMAMGILSLVATDYVELFGYQDSGGSLNTGSATAALANHLQIVKLW